MKSSQWLAFLFLNSWPHLQGPDITQVPLVYIQRLEYSSGHVSRLSWVSGDILHEPAPEACRHLLQYKLWSIKRFQLYCDLNNPEKFCPLMIQGMSHFLLVSSRILINFSITWKYALTIYQGKQIWQKPENCECLCWKAWSKSPKMLAVQIWLQAVQLRKSFIDNTQRNNCCFSPVTIFVKGKLNL